ncbi:hypothetical protein [Rickettsia oklahomensis]|uniref:Uncharacterized protein n=1 Tax=Rickettsia oklahomensis TaxID=3141789 RepID=A0AAU7BYA5_9RICK
MKSVNNLKEIVEKHYKEKPDKKYISQIIKLFDKCVIIDYITKTAVFNIFDNEMFEKFIKRTDIMVVDMA